MGGLTWDEQNFPNPAQKIASYRADGLGVVLIEEPFISRGVKDKASGKTVHSILESKGYLATETPEKGAKAAFIDYSPWWGRGALYDYSDKEAADFFHDFRRQALVDLGITGHWTDLGEPEMFVPEAFYGKGRFKHADIHNIYNLRWSKSIAEGYERHNVTRRPWILSRSGTSGIQRYGVGLWSGDIGSNLSSLSTHLNAQMHMSFSGVDYFGSDIGGFYRHNLQGGSEHEMFTQWFAVGSLLDVPVRVHTFNVNNKYETAPDRVGDKASNLFNIRQRYALNPYYYSLAHAAFTKGEPLFAPLTFYFQNDLNARKLGDHKMIGKDLLAVTISKYGQTSADVYLPKGGWYNFHSGSKVESLGEWQKNVSAFEDKIFRLPLFAREGAIFPMAKDEDLLIRVYPGRAPSSFKLAEDDGETISYQKGEVRSTEIRQALKGETLTVTMDPAEGWKTDLTNQTIWLETSLPGANFLITLNGAELPRMADEAALAAQLRVGRSAKKGF